MMDFIALRFDAPLMSFGGPVVDQQGVTDFFPGRSLLTGLLGNALGWEHGEFEKLGALQSALVYAVRCDRKPKRITDYQTVDLSQPFMQRGWTTWGRPEERGGGSSDGTHIRFRSFLADGVYTIAFTLDESCTVVSLNDLRAALQEPARPLFIGRKACIPSGPVYLGSQPTRAENVLDALCRIPPVEDRPGDSNSGRVFDAQWPDGLDSTAVLDHRLEPVYDERDWTNQIHTGRRFVRRGRIRLMEE